MWAAILVTISMHVIVAASTKKEEWPLRPHKVYVCEGDKARFQWEYDHSLGEYVATFFNRIRPNHQVLYFKNTANGQKTDSGRVRLVDNHNSSFQMDDVALSDNGTYEIELYLQNPDKLIFDECELHVIKRSACPNKEHFQHPRVYFKHNVTTDTLAYSFTNETVSMRVPGEISIMVEVPPADPPVTCVICEGNVTTRCQGACGNVTVCVARLTAEQLRELNNQSLVVNLSFTAFDNSSTRIKVINQDDVENAHQTAVEKVHPEEKAQPGTGQPQPPVHTEGRCHPHIPVVVGVGLVSVVLSFLAGFFVSRHWESVRKPKKPKSFQAEEENLRPSKNGEAA